MTNLTATRKIKILRVVIGLNQGGVQQGVLNLCRGLDAERYELIVCAIENHGAIGKEIEQAGFPVIVLGYERKAWQTIRALRDLMREQQIDIVHASSYHPSIYARLAAVWAGVPIRLSYEHVVFDHKRGQRVFMNRLLAPFTQGYTTVGKAVAAQVKAWYGYADQKVHVMHNGVDIQRFKPLATAAEKQQQKQRLGFSTTKPVIGMVSRLNQEKGHRYLFAAIKELKSDYDAEWLIIGTGREAAKIKSQADAYGVSNDVRFLGLRRDIPEILQALDVFVFPTLQEGFPNVLLEAMAAACPVVASDFAGNLEVAEHERNSLIIPMKDIHALSHAIERLLQNDDLAKQLAIQARQDIVTNFSLSAYANRMADYYQALCKAKGLIE